MTENTDKVNVHYKDAEKSEYIQSKLKQLIDESYSSIPRINESISELKESLQKSIYEPFADIKEIIQKPSTNTIFELNETLQKSISKPIIDLNEALQKLISKPLADLNETLQNSIYESINDLFSQVSKKIEFLPEDIRICNKYRKLGRQNWVLPLKHSELPNVDASTENLNQDIKNLYSENENEMLKWIVNQINEHLTISSQRQMVNEAEISYTNGNYNACSYTLAPLVEGILSTIIQGNKWNDLLDKFTTNVLNSISPWGFAYHIFCGLYLFLKNYMGFAEFSNPENEPEFLNRHWMLHGRTHKTCTDIHCLQLFGALWGILSIASLCEFTEGETDTEIIESFKKSNQCI